MSVRAARLTGRPRDHVSSIVVAALSATFGVVLLEATGLIATVVDSSGMTEGSGTVRAVLSVVTTVFTLIAVYVGAIVTANTFSTIIAGRVREIALLRLIGAQASLVRRSVATEGLIVGLIGAGIGLLLGIVIAVVTVAVGMAQGWLPELEYGFLDPAILLPVGVVALTTWAAAWIGSRTVTTVTPLAATGASVEATREESIRRPVRNVMAIVLFVLGIGLLLLGVAVGLVSVFGLLIAFAGGVLSFTGIVVGAHLIMPSVLSLVGRMLGRRPPARLAAENAVRFPDRSSRATIGLVIGVTLVIMFAVAMQSYTDMITSQFSDDPVALAAIDQTLTVTTAIFTGLVGFSAVIAAVGMVNNLSLSVLQRTRELGLLRALGFTGRQVRSMIVAESTQMTVAAVGLGLLLGVFYGWAAAQSMLGSIVDAVVAPSLPWGIIGITVGAGIVLTLAASVAPARRATTISPVVALAVA